MIFRELTSEEFKNFHKNYNIKSIYQNVNYGNSIKEQSNEILYLGLIDNNKIVAASLIIIEKHQQFKYAYAPRGFLIDYNDYKLLEFFTNEIKKYLGKLNIIAVKISPLIIKEIHNTKDNNEINLNYNTIFNNFKKLGYYHLGYNNYFEAIKPRFEAIIDLNSPYYLLFNNIKKEFRTKVRSAEKMGIKVYKGSFDNLELLYSHTKNKYPRDLKYIKSIYKAFSQNNEIEFFYTKLDTSKYLKLANKNFQIQEEICTNLNSRLLNNNSVLTEKMESDTLLNKYKNNLIEATKLLNEYPNGIVTSSVLILKNDEEIFLLVDGYDKKFKNFNSKHLLIWKLIEKYSNEKFKKFNLNGVINPLTPNTKYKGLNEFKLGFNPKIIEYIGDLELVTNKSLYFMYKNKMSIKNILKK